MLCVNRLRFIKVSTIKVSPQGFANQLKHDPVKISLISSQHIMSIIVFQT